MVFGVREKFAALVSGKEKIPRLVLGWGREKLTARFWGLGKITFKVFEGRVKLPAWCGGRKMLPTWFGELGKNFQHGLGVQKNFCMVLVVWKNSLHDFGGRENSPHSFVEGKKLPAWLVMGEVKKLPAWFRLKNEKLPAWFNWFWL